jgi:hypothetical protein
MLSQFRTSILISSASLLLTFISSKGKAQEKFDSKLLKNGKYTLACYAVNGNNESEIGTFTIGINAANDKLALTTITALAGLEEWKDTAISNVEEVKNSTWVSKYTGKHEVWEVTVLEPSTDEKSVSYIDKKTRRLWQVDAWSNGQQIRMVDMETDFNSVKSPFDKEATMKMVKGGNAIINGQVFARDFNDNGTI